MADLIKLTTDRDGAEELSELMFDPIPVGESDEQRIFVQNQTKQTVTIDPEVSELSGSGNIAVVSYDERIEPDESGEIVLEAEAIDAEQLTGISANIEVNATATIPPNQSLN